MKRVLTLLIALIAIALSTSAQDISITSPNDTSETVIAVGGAETVTIKADVLPLVDSKTTSDTIIVFRYLKSPSEAAYYEKGDTIFVNDSVLNTAIKTYKSNYFSYFKFRTLTDTTSTATLNFYIKTE